MSDVDPPFRRTLPWRVEDAQTLSISGGGPMLLAAPDVEHTHTWGVWLGRQLRAGDVVILVGELGAGKTTLTQGIADGLHVRGPITSPTFILSRIHPSLVGGPNLVHVDAYRLDSSTHVDDLDLDSTLPSSVTVVEWGMGVAEHLCEDFLEVRLEIGDSATASAPLSVSERTITLVPHGHRWQGDRTQA